MWCVILVKKIMLRAELKQYGCNDELNFFQRINLYFFKLKIKNIKLGSDKWHILQEYLSNLPDVGFFAYKRSLFYMKTMNCDDKFYAAKGVIIYYPQNIKIGTYTRFNRNVFITAAAIVDMAKILEFLTATNTLPKKPLRAANIAVITRI